MRLTPLVKNWGLNVSSVLRHILIDPEGRKYVQVKPFGKIHVYQVIDPEGLKNFLKRKGFPIREEKHA